MRKSIFTLTYNQIEFLHIIDNSDSQFDIENSLLRNLLFQIKENKTIRKIIEYLESKYKIEGIQVDHIADFGCLVKVCFMAAHK